MTQNNNKMAIRTGVVIFVALVVVVAIAGAFIIGGLAGKLNVSPFSKPINAAELLVRDTLALARGHEQNAKYFESALLELKLTTLAAMPGGEGDKVGFAAVGDGHIVATRRGELYHVKLHWPDEATVTSMDVMVPTEKERFLQHPITDKHPRIPVQFGVKGIHAEQQQDKVSVYASYHYWKDAEECAVMRIARIDVPASELTQTRDADWTVLYETSPCMKLDGKMNRLGEDDTFLQAGGRITSYDNERLIVTIGDHFLEGIHNTDYVQDRSASYGKTWLINKDTGDAEMFSLGHRNPQGIAVDQHGLVWASEHGPRGGDEINLLAQGANFGWPLASLGTLYAGYLYPEGHNWSSHEGYEPPKYAWSPSIAPSNLIRLNDSNFARWGDDLILSSLSGRSIYRLSIEGAEVVAVERIEIGDRLRDIAQTEDGNLLMMSDGGVFFKLEPAQGDTAAGGDESAGNDAARGRALWMTCAACHQLSSDEKHRIGPNLHDVVDRQIAVYDNFNYSTAMQAIEGEWTVERLDRFLAAPMSDIPGTTMAFPGIKDEHDRKALIDYLQSESN